MANAVSMAKIQRDVKGKVEMLKAKTREQYQNILEAREEPLCPFSKLTIECTKVDIFYCSVCSRFEGDRKTVTRSNEK